MSEGDINLRWRRCRREWREDRQVRRLLIGVHILMGEKAPAMLKNVNQAIVSGQVEPVEIVAVAGGR